jgi:hypothetical protein
MKRISIILLLGLLLNACQSDETQIPTQCVKVKIIATICGMAVLQIQDPAYYGYGEKGWASGGQVFDHVFFTEFSCQDEQTLSQLARPNLVGLVLNVKFLEKADADSCVRCKAMVANPPATRQYVQLKTSCAEVGK